ncbi:hypothetical protein TIFTF001_052708 [Ficus carica]|uniref:C-JID domain-containing protein n=1 Tax=Ficus carica TaxID=3494 RepID=A0AA88EKU4_FICCA|nr:hypothetical protein TIFTF001_029597 [Ficus carica]GMN71609.1 hypothetical protein TIFTF001_052708 [Ficus carica]
MLDGSNIEGMPVNIKNLCKLIELVIRHCKRLKSLPELPSSLELLDESECISLEMISNSRDTLEQWFKSGNHVMTYRKFLSVDCFKLDQNACNNIVTEFQLRALDTGFKSVLPHSIFQKSDCTPGVGICCPGNKIPMWFTHQSKSSSLKVKLPSNWRNTNFLGFTLCAVLAENPYFISKLFMWYECGNYHNCLDTVEASFSFSEKVIRLKSVERSQVKACRIRLVYIQDAEELGITNNLGISNVVHKTGVVNSDIDDQRLICKTSKPSRSSNEPDLGEKLVTTSRRDGSGEALVEEADELGGFGKESVTGIARMGHRHMDYDNVQTATGGVDEEEDGGGTGLQKVDVLVCWGKKGRRRRRRRRVIEEKLCT